MGSRVRGRSGLAVWVLVAAVAVGLTSCGAGPLEALDELAESSGECRVTSEGGWTEGDAGVVLFEMANRFTYDVDAAARTLSVEVDNFSGDSGPTGTSGATWELTEVDDDTMSLRGRFEGGPSNAGSTEGQPDWYLLDWQVDGDRLVVTSSPDPEDPDGWTYEERTLIWEVDLEEVRSRDSFSVTVKIDQRQHQDAENPAPAVVVCSKG